MKSRDRASNSDLHRRTRRACRDAFAADRRTDGEPLRFGGANPYASTGHKAANPCAPRQKAGVLRSIASSIVIASAAF